MLPNPVIMRVRSPPSPYYIGFHIQGFCNSKEGRRDFYMPQKLETVLAKIETLFLYIKRRHWASSQFIIIENILPQEYLSL